MGSVGGPGRRACLVVALAEAVRVAVGIGEHRPRPPELLARLFGEVNALSRQLPREWRQVVDAKQHVAERANPFLLAGRSEEDEQTLRSAAHLDPARGLRIRPHRPATSIQMSWSNSRAVWSPIMPTLPLRCSVFLGIAELLPLAVKTKQHMAIGCGMALVTHLNVVSSRRGT